MPQRLLIHSRAGKNAFHLKVVTMFSSADDNNEPDDKNRSDKNNVTAKTLGLTLK